MIKSEKSGIYFSTNVNSLRRDLVCSILGFNRKLDNEIYLGLPLAFGKNRSREFKGVVEKVRARVQSWNSQFLSNGGKGILIKACARAIHIYVMSCFLFPKKVVNEINSIVVGYWWRDRGTFKKFRWRR